MCALPFSWTLIATIATLAGTRTTLLRLCLCWQIPLQFTICTNKCFALKNALLSICCCCYIYLYILAQGSSGKASVSLTQLFRVKYPFIAPCHKLLGSKRRKMKENIKCVLKNAAYSYILHFIAAFAPFQNKSKRSEALK